MRNSVLLYSLLCFILVSSCSSDGTKKNISKAGDVAGQAVGEFVSGVSSGVQKVFDMTIQMPRDLENKGVKFGKISVKNGSEGVDNLLVVYFIFDKDFNENLTVKVFDRKGMEMGRSKQKVEGVKGDAKFVEFQFDKHTNIDLDSKLTIE